MLTFKKRRLKFKLVRYIASTALITLLAPGVFASDLCPDYKSVNQFNPERHDYCSELWTKVRSPSDKNGTPYPLDQYEKFVGEFFNNHCHRDPELKNSAGVGWGRDKDVRDTGPYTATRDANGDWVGAYHGFHAPVVIWYSPEMMEWLQRNRPADGEAVNKVEAIPDGAIIAKEMYTPPGSRCRGLDIDKLQPAHGIAYMVRDNKAATDGWFWGYFGHFPAGENDPNIDWPPRPDNSPAYAGFGQYCLNCHASAENNGTFSDLANIEGQPGQPISYLSQDWFLTEVEADLPLQLLHSPQHVDAPVVKSSSVPPAFSNRFPLPPEQSLGSVESFSLPSQTYDNVWVKAGETAPISSEYVTSDQCAGCHDAGSTGLRFDMTKPNPHGDDLINLSPYATWRTSPMGLAGRDPIFYAQLSSEEGMHSGSLDLIWNTCFGCHGIMGQRQFQLDHASTEQECEAAVFTPDIITAVPYSKEQTKNKTQAHYDLDAAPYGALARDGVSCIACHRAALTPDQTAKYDDQAQNTCIKARQNTLNANPDLGGLSGFAKTFTGSFTVSDPGTVFGPFENPKTKPMSNALNAIPEHDDAIASSEQCGTCHTVHLPVLWQPDGKGEPEFIADTYEQTTYPEWLFSEFRTGTAAFLPKGEMLPGGAGDTPQSCVDCHMESQSDNGTVYKSKIASIQERSNMPEAAYALGAEDIDLDVRDNFARHTLVGLNLFLVSMADQFPNVLGIPTVDPMLGKKGLAPIKRTANEMVVNATKRTAQIDITGTTINAGNVVADIKIKNLVGHKFPSGVSFRRAFVRFEVLSESNKVLWQSGAVDQYGVLIDNKGAPLAGELWYDQSCNKVVDQTSYQPHYQTITSPEQVQIYQEVKLNPGDPKQVSHTPSCEVGAPIEPSANLTTSFLSICHTAKDNRLMPAGQPPEDIRLAIAQKLGLSEEQAHKLVEETSATGVGDDPDYVTGGGDSFTYEIPLSSISETPHSVRASLHYQATPPFYLQDRFCTASGASRDRLYYLSAMLETDGTPIEDWTFSMVSTGSVTIEQ